MNAISEAKRTLRRRALDHRRQRPAQAVSQAGEAIRRRVSELPAFASARVLHSYVDALPGELPTRPLLADALARAVEVIIPVVGADRQLRHHRVARLDELARGAMQLWTPTVPDWVEDLSRLDVILVPGAAFDVTGRRLGLGGGYYDRLLKSLPPSTRRIALCTDAWVVDEVPVDAHDEPVHVIVTETRVIPTEKGTPS